MATVVTLLADLSAGRTTIEEVAVDFRQRQWPRPHRTPAELEAAEREQQDDPQPIEPESFTPVVIAWHRGELTDEQYRTLSEAAR